MVGGMRDIGERLSRFGNDRLGPPAVRLSGAVLLILCVGAVGTFLYTALQRMAYPFDLEWCESACLATVGRVLSGQPLYTPPSLDYVSYQYMPLYYYVSALSSLVFGYGLFSLRLVSFLSTLVVFAVLYAMGRRETGRAVWGVVALALFASLYDVTFGWFDLARVDMLQLAFLAAGVYFSRFHADSRKGAVAAGLCFFGACFTKQSAMVMILPLLMYLVWSKRWNGVLISVLCLGSLALATGILHVRSDGWSTFYTFQLLGEHSRDNRLWLGFWESDLLHCVPVVTILALGFLLLPDAGNFRNRFFYLALTAGVLAGCWMSRLHSGSMCNSTLPAYTLLSLLAVLGAKTLIQIVRQAGPPWRGQVLACLLFSMQIAALAYSPAKFIPSKADLTAGNQLLEALRKIDGDVFVPAQSSLTILAGKKPHAHYVPITDIYRGKCQEAKDILSADMKKRFSANEFSLLLLSNGKIFERFFKPYYRLAKPLLFKGPLFHVPLEGWARPKLVYVNKAKEPGLMPFVDVLPFRIDSGQ